MESIIVIKATDFSSLAFFKIQPIWRIGYPKFIFNGFVLRFTSFRNYLFNESLRKDTVSEDFLFQLKKDELMDAKVILLDNIIIGLSESLKKK